MDKSSKGSMFDGLQIFGKTDAKFSMTNSMNSLGSSSSRPALNSNYQFDNQQSVLLPPGPYSEGTSLPSNSTEEEELPPDSYPLEPLSLDPRQLGPRRNMQTAGRPRSSSGDRNVQTNLMSASLASGLPKTWSRTSRPVVQNSVPPVSKPTEDDLPPLQEVSFRGSAPSAGSSQVSEDRPHSFPTFSPEPDVKSDSKKMTFFFDRASSEIEKFELDLNSMKSDHERDSCKIVEEMKLCEDTIRASSLLSIQKLLDFEKSASLVEELQSKIKIAINANSYDEADRLQKSLEDVLKDVQQSQLLQFQPPRQLQSTEDKLRTLNANRKSHVDSLKNFCVSLDEHSTRFKSITKKIEVQCSSKIDKQKQELESAQTALNCRLKHLTIDKDYLEQRETSLTNELRVTTEDHNLQVCQYSILLSYYEPFVSYRVPTKFKVN